MFFGLFEIYTSTDSKYALRRKMGPICVDRPSAFIYNKILEKFKSDGFSNITADPDYLDIYGEKRGFEVSIQIAANGLSSFIEISVLGEHKRGRTRKFFKKYYNSIRDSLLTY